MPTIRTDEEKKELIKKVDELREKEGLTVEEATKQLKFHTGSYYVWKRDGGKKPTKIKKVNSKKPELVTFNLPDEKETIFIAFGHAKDVVNVIEKIAEINQRNK